MPIFRAGRCYMCYEYSNMLLPEIGFEQGEIHFIVAFLCPKCRDMLRKMREQNGDFDAKID